MEPLTPNISSLLNVYTINLLKKQRITTVGEFLRADSKKLIETINLGRKSNFSPFMKVDSIC